MKNFFSIFLLCILCCCLAVPTFALEVEYGGETNIGSDLVDSADNLGSFSLGEPSEAEGDGEVTTSEPLETEPFEVVIDTSDPDNVPTVDLTDETIDKIADAVTGDVLSVTNKDGVVYSIPEEVLEYWDSMAYKAYVGSVSSFSYWLLSDVPFTVQGDVWAGSGHRFVLVYGKYSNSILSSSFKYGFTTSDILWSNFDIKSTNDDTLVYQSDIPVAYTVFFETGFNDLLIDSQLHTDLVLPTPSYPGYTFAGWYYDGYFTERFDSTLPITSDIVLHARWIETPKMAFFHETIFNSFVHLFTYEPMIYIFSLMGLICVFAVGKRLIAVKY